MAWPLIRIDLDEHSTDFQRTALQPGFPVLDRFGANSSVIHSWLGRFAADAQWDEQTVRYFWRDDDDDTPPAAVVPATMAELRGSLRAEVDALKAKAKSAVAKTPNDRALLGVVQQRLERALAGASETGSLLKVKTHGRWQLVWCWGYDRRNTEPASLRICPKESCRLASLADSESLGKCPRCGAKFRSRSVMRSMALMILLLLLLGGGFYAWDRAGRPGLASSVELQGVVVDATSGKPISGAEIQSESNPELRMQSDQKGEFALNFKGQPLGIVRVSSPGYHSEKWEPPTGKRPVDRQRIEMRGEADAVGLVIEALSDHPIPNPVIHALPSDREGVGDEVGLFQIPGLPSGKTEFEVTADGYLPTRVTHELLSGRSPDLLFSLVGSGAVKGTVMDAYDRRPVIGAIIVVTGFPGETQSDNDGKFHRGELPGTTCRFEVSAPGYLTRDFERLLEKTGETPLRFLLRPELTTLDGIVVDSSGTAVPDATVRMSGFETTALTSADGRFRLTGVRQGLQKVEVSATGYQPTAVEFSVPSADGQPTRIVLNGSSRLIGRVLDAVRKSPVKDAEIRVSEGRWKATVDEQGRFEIAGLPAGHVDLEVVGRGYRAAKSEAMLAGGDNKLEFELRGATVLSGTVKSDFDQQPIAGAEVQLEGIALPQTTDGEGRFRFEDLAAGVARVSAKANGYRPSTEDRETRADEETIVAFKLRGASRLAGKVVAAETSQPISGAEVTVAGTDRKFVTDDKGEFSQDDWPGRQIRLRVVARGFLPQEQDHDLSVSSVAEVIVRLKPPHSIVGIVVDASSDKPVAAAKVSLAGQSDATTTDADGRFQFETPPAESYEFVVSSAGYPTQTLVEQLSQVPKVVSDGPLGKTDSSPAAVAMIKLSLHRDMETPRPNPAQSAEPASGPPPEQPWMPSSADDTAPPPSTAEQFGPSQSGPRDPQDVEFFGVKSKAANVAFVVDNSGSMADPRLERTKLELLRTVLDLHPKQMYYVAFFSDGARPMFDDAKAKPIVAKPVNKVRTYKWMETILIEGGTNPQPALELTAAFSPQSIYLLSDGVFAPLPEPLYEKFQKQPIRVSTIAMEDDSGKQELMTIAARTQGRYRFVQTAPIPDLFKVWLLTRLYDELLQQWFDPQTTTSDAVDAHEALVEFANGKDFGPRRNASDAERRHAYDQWREWWVKHKLTPEILDREEIRLKKNLTNRSPWWRWASLDALDQKGVQDGGVFIPKVRDPDGGIQQAARRALIRIAGDEDHGPPEGAGLESIREAFEKWTEWLRREKYIANLKKKTADSLVQDFDHPHEKVRRAALQAAADLPKFSQPAQLIKKLTDPDVTIRRSAHAALVKTAGRDFGPRDCANMASCVSAAKEWSKWNIEKSEGEAEKTLRLAESLEASKKYDAAIKWYQELVQKHPGTDAATKAAAKLKQLLPKQAKTNSKSKKSQLENVDPSQLVGRWQDAFFGTRTLTFKDDGTASMALELEGPGKLMFGNRLDFNLRWSLTGTAVTITILNGVPAKAAMSAISKWGNQHVYHLDHIDENQIQMHDSSGAMNHTLRRLPI